MLCVTNENRSGSFNKLDMFYGFIVFWKSALFFINAKKEIYC